MKTLLLILCVKKNTSKQVTAKSSNANIFFLVCKPAGEKIANVVYILHGFLFANGHVIVALAGVMNVLLSFLTTSIKTISPGARKVHFCFIFMKNYMKGRRVISLFTDHSPKMHHSIFVTHLFQCQRFTVNIHKKYNRRLQY